MAKIISTKESLQEFKNSTIWKDLSNELIEWKEAFANELMALVSSYETSNPSTASVLLHMGDINGRIKAVDYMLSLPDLFIQLLESQPKENN